MKQQTRLNPISQPHDEAEDHRSLPEAWGLLAGVVVVLLLVLSVWFGLDVQSSGRGLDIDVPAAPTGGLLPSV